MDADDARRQIDDPAGGDPGADPGPDGYASVVDKRGDDVLDPGVEGVAPTTVAALLKP
jgi:hypothetical protein